MPNALTIALHASAAETAGGNSASVDLGDRSLLQLTLDVTAITSAATLTVSVQSSDTQSAWELAKRMNPVAAVGAVRVAVPMTKRYARVSWVITGTSPSVTFAISGAAHQLYCQPGELSTYGIPGTALEGIPPEQLGLSCLSASDEAAGYLASAYTLPLTAWDTDLRKHVAYMGVFDLLAARGYEPASGKDSLIETRRDQAISWLRRIADGKLRPPGIVDTTPVEAEPEVYVACATGRSWLR